MAAEYNWTDASTPQGRERLKQLLDEGCEVLIQNPPFSVGYARRCKSGEYTCNGYIPSHKWDSASFEGMEFLDPSPRLEPKPLEWQSGKDYDWAQHNEWIFDAYPNGVWYVYLGTVFVEGIHEPPAGTMETAKAAIHEWRVNHLKSILK